MATIVTTNVLEHFLDSLSECLPPAVAQQIVAIPPDAATDERLEYLREGANQGTLTDAERVEYADLVEAIDVVSLIKLKARIRARRGE